MSAVCLVDGCPDYASEGTHTHMTTQPAQDRTDHGQHPFEAVVSDRLAAEAKSRAEQIAATVDSITKWWSLQAEDDAKVTAPKAAEYGASDLAIMGKAMEGLYPGIDQLPPEERERIGLEMAVAFYVLGKAARLFGAYEQGRMPGPDSWFDLTVYSMMARRIRDVGYWV